MTKNAPVTLRGYHGGKTAIEKFDKAHIGTNTGSGWLGDGFYFSPHADAARSYGSTITRVEVRLKNPYRFPEDENPIRWVKEHGGGAAFTRWVEEQGHDGIISEAVLHQIVAFEPSQIRVLGHEVMAAVSAVAAANKSAAAVVKKPGTGGGGKLLPSLALMTLYFGTVAAYRFAKRRRIRQITLVEFELARSRRLLLDADWRESLNLPPADWLASDRATVAKFLRLCNLPEGVVEPWSKDRRIAAELLPRHRQRVRVIGCVRSLRALARLRRRVWRDGVRGLSEEDLARMRTAISEIEALRMIIAQHGLTYPVWAALRTRLAKPPKPKLLLAAEIKLAGKFPF